MVIVPQTPRLPRAYTHHHNPTHTERLTVSAIPQTAEDRTLGCIGRALLWQLSLVPPEEQKDVSRLLQETTEVGVHETPASRPLLKLDPLPRLLSSSVCLLTLFPFFQIWFQGYLLQGTF